MRRSHGFTLIELMITVAVISILAAIAYPSYQDHIRRGIRSQGQQFLLDIAQRQEQFFLDNRAYGTTLAQLNMTVPPEVAAKYGALAITPVVGPPLGYVATLPPGAQMAADGTLVINNLQQSWREVSSLGAFVAKADPNDASAVGDCRWEESRCVPK